MEKDSPSHWACHEEKRVLTTVKPDGNLSRRKQRILDNGQRLAGEERPKWNLSSCLGSGLQEKHECMALD